VLYSKKVTEYAISILPRREANELHRAIEKYTSEDVRRPSYDLIIMSKW